MPFPGASADYIKTRQALMAEEIEFRPAHEPADRDALPGWHSKLST